MKTRTAVLLLGIGVVIAAIVVVAKLWPSLPKRTTPKPVAVSVMPMAGETIDMAKAGCLAPMIAELRKRPNWSLRIDDMRWTDYTQPPDDPKHATIVIEPSGAVWRSEFLPSQTLALTPEDTSDVLAAFDRSCEADHSNPTGAYEGRYINVAYNKDGPASARLHAGSAVVLRLGEVFERVRARYVANRAGATKTFKISLYGVLRDNSHYDPKPEWRNYSFELDSKFVETDAERVDWVDWAMSLPTKRPKHPQVASGTLVIDGASRPIAASLDRGDPSNRILDRLNIGELGIWMTVNREEPRE